MSTQVYPYLTAIHDAARNRDLAALSASYHQATKVLGVQQVHAELPVLCAEVALQLRAFRFARECLRYYHHHCAGGHPPRLDQFYVRVLLAEAVLIVSDAVYEETSGGAPKGGFPQGGGETVDAPLRGDELTEVVMSAVALIEKALDVVEGQQQATGVDYAFLVHNASVAYWTCVRVLSRSRGRVAGVLVSSMTRVVEMLAALPEEQCDVPWLVRNYLRLAQACDSAEQRDGALKAVQAAEKLLPEDATLDLQTRVLRLTVHMARHKGPEAAAKSLAARVPGGAAVVLLQMVRSGVTDHSAAKGKLRGVMDTLSAQSDEARPDDSRRAEYLHLQALLARCGLLAAQLLDFDTAQDAVRLTSVSKQLGTHAATVLAQLINAHLRFKGVLVEPGDEELTLPRWASPDENPDEAARLAEKIETRCRLNALKDVEAAARVAARLDDAELVEESAHLAWTLVVPLLNENTRTLIERPLKACCAALGQVDSLDHELRVLMHLEIAKCEVAAEFLDKASVHLNAARTLDYTLDSSAVPQDVEDPWVRRGFLLPYDRFVQPMFLSLHLKQSLYSFPESPEEQALLLVEQARDALTNSSCRTMLQQASRALSDNQVKLSELSNRNRALRFTVWTSMARIAWKRGFQEETRAAARRALAFQWDKAGNRAFVVDQIDINCILAELCAVEITERLAQFQAEVEEARASRAATAFGDEHDSGDEEDAHEDAAAEAHHEDMAVDDAIMEEANSRTHQEMLQALQAALELRDSEDDDDTWVAHNVATYLWNFHAPLVEQVQAALSMQARRGPDAVLPLLFKKALASPRLTPQLIDTLVLSRKHISDEPRDLPVLLQVTRALALVHEAQGRHDEAITVCDSAKGTPSMKKHLMRCKARCLVQLGRLDERIGERLERAIVKIEWLECAQVDRDAKRKLILELRKDVEEQEEAGSEAARRLDAELRSLLASSAVAWLELGQDASPEENTQVLAVAISAADMALKALPAVVPGCEILEESQVAPDDSFDLASVSPERWRWYAIATSARGRCLSLLIDPKTQEKRSQDLLRRRSLCSFARAARFAQLSRRAPDLSTTILAHGPAPAPAWALLILRSAHLFWNTAIPLMSSALTRGIVEVPLNFILRQLELALEGPTKLDPEFRVKLYRLLLECLQDEELWSEGLHAAERAMQFLPAETAKSLWRQRAVFMSKLGEDVTVSVERLRSIYSPKDQAELWASLARAANSKEQQFSFFQMAMSSVALVDPLEAVDFLIEFGEWLFANGFPREDAEDQLFLAADILHDIESDALEAEEEARSVYSASRRSARSSRVESSVRSGGSGRSGRSGRSVRSGRSGRSGRSSKKGLPSGLHKPARSTTTSIYSARSTRRSVRSSASTASGRASSAGPPVPDSLNAKHLLSLVQIYTMLSQMAPTVALREELALVAQHFVQRLWETVVDFLNAQAKHRWQREQKKLKGGRGKKKRRKHRKATDTLGVGSSLGAPSSASSASALSDAEEEDDGEFELPYSVPRATHEWIEFEPSAELRKAVKKTGASSSKRRAAMSIGKHSVSRPELKVFYLKRLANSMEELGFVVHSLPVLSLLELLAEDVIELRALAGVTQLRMGRVFAVLGREDRRETVLARAEPMLPTSSEEQAFLEQVQQREQLNSIVTATSMMRIQSRQDLVGLAAGAGAGAGKKQQKEDKMVVSDVPIRQVWVELAELLVCMGRLGEADELLERAERHCKAFKDDACLSHLQRVRMMMAALQGNLPGAIQLEYVAQHRGGEAYEWRRGIVSLVVLLQDRGRDRLQRTAIHDQIVGLLRHSIKVFAEVKGLEGVRTLACCEVLLACVQSGLRLDLARCLAASNKVAGSALWAQIAVREEETIERVHEVDHQAALEMLRVAARRLEKVGDWAFAAQAWRLRAIALGGDVECLERGVEAADKALFASSLPMQSVGVVVPAAVLVASIKVDLARALLAQEDVVEEAGGEEALFAEFAEVFRDVEKEKQQPVEASRAERAAGEAASAVALTRTGSVQQLVAKGVLGEALGRRELMEQSLNGLLDAGEVAEAARVCFGLVRLVGAEFMELAANLRAWLTAKRVFQLAAGSRSAENLALERLRVLDAQGTSDERLRAFVDQMWSVRRDKVEVDEETAVVTVLMDAGKVYAAAGGEMVVKEAVEEALREVVKVETVEGKHLVLVLGEQVARLDVEGMLEEAIGVAQSCVREFSMGFRARRGEAVDVAESVGAIVDAGHHDAEDVLVGAVRELDKDWDMLWGGDHAPVAGEWQGMLSTKDALVVLTPGKLLSHVDVLDVAGMRVRSKVIVCVDRLTTDESERWETALENQKRRHVRDLERVFETALLLSLRGAQSVLLSKQPRHVQDGVEVLQAVGGGVVPGMVAYGLPRTQWL